MAFASELKLWLPPSVPTWRSTTERWERLRSITGCRIGAVGSGRTAAPAFGATGSLRMWPRRQRPRLLLYRQKRTVR